MSVHRLLPQRHRILFVVAFVALRLAVYSIVLFKFFILMTLPQSIAAYIGTLIVVAGIWKLAGWFEPQAATAAQQDGALVHPLVGAPVQLAPGAARTATAVAAPTPVVASNHVAHTAVAAPPAPLVVAAPAVPAALSVDVSVNIFAVPAMRVSAPAFEAEPTVAAPVALIAPHESAAALVAAMGSAWPTTAGPSFELPLPAWMPPAAPQFSGAHASS
ncbi:MAG: hypothetical protein H7287_07955 [Thermoleophilia bacterium]|nr:hypothetical protein [Thermoleophilia bacterium]